MSDDRRFRPEDLARTRRLGEVAASPDGRWAVLSIAELNAKGDDYDTNLWRLDLRGTGAEPVALTADTRKKSTLRFRPDGKLGYLAEPDPSERREKEPEGEKDEKPKRQLHLLDLGGGVARRLTDLAGGVQDFRWSADGSRLALLAPLLPGAESLEHDRELRAARKDEAAKGVLHETWPLRFWDRFVGPDFAHLLVAGPDGEAPRDLTPGLGFALHESSLSVTGNGSHATVDWTDVDDDRRLWSRACLIDLETGERSAFTEGNENSSGGRVSPDGSRLVAMTGKRSPGTTGRRELVDFDVATRRRSSVTDAHDLWPDGFEFLDDECLLWTADDDGRHRLRLQRLGEDDSQVLTAQGCVKSWCPLPDGRGALAVIDSFDAPADLFLVKLDGSEPQRLTELNKALTEACDLAPGRSVTFEGADGRDVQAWELKPPGFDASKRYPFLLWIHGGPLGSYRDEFHARWNAALYAAAGYVVVAVNPAGSTGFGQDLVESNHANWGDVCYRDLMAAADRWCAEPWVDETRTAALGASFGGYMVNWIHGQTDRFSCLVCHAGLFDMRAFHGATDVAPNWEIEFGGPPVDEGSRWELHSPHEHVDRWSTPTLVIHGELDYRVPLGEGLAAYQALQRRGVPSKFLYFPDENHWILKPANLVQWNRTVLDWLGEYLNP
jgi:dipeptidyl aminopeptidase/acylaminoacyl peptidase